MTIRIYETSDVHLEFGKFKHTSPDCDVAVLAGDIGVGHMALPWIERTFLDKNIPVVLVNGNHEFYGRDLVSHTEQTREKCAKLGIHFLQNNSVEIMGYTFIGGTLWTDFNLLGNQPLAMLDAQSKMNDYNQITKNGVLITPQDILEEHLITKMFIESFADTPDLKKIIVTHHPALPECINSRYDNHPLNPMYTNRMYSTVERVNPLAWFSGHMHNSFDFMLGETRFVCNPRGYIGYEINPEFIPNLVVELP